MKALEIRTTGEVLLMGEVVGQISFAKAYVEDDVAGLYWPEAYGCTSCADHDEKISDLEDEVAALKGKIANLDGLHLLRASHAHWSEKTFGNVSAVGPAKHLAKEALEVAADPLDAMEHADCWMLLWDMQRRAGISDKALRLAIARKLAINKARTWPAPQEGEAREHDRSAEVSK